MSPQPTVEELWEAGLSRQQRLIVGLLIKAYPRPVDAGKIVTAMYASEPDGGAEMASQVVRVQISRARSKMSPFGWTISNAKTGRGNYGEYRLVRHSEGKH